MDVDIRTGRPKEEQKIDPKKGEIIGQLEHNVALGLHVESVMASDKGQELIRIIAERLEKRIDNLVKEDPSAAALLALLSDMGHMISVGRSSAERLIKMRMENK